MVRHQSSNFLLFFEVKDGTAGMASICAICQRRLVWWFSLNQVI